MNILNLFFQYLALLLVVIGFIVVFRSRLIQQVLRQGLELMAHKKYLWFIAAFAGLATYGGEVNFFTNRLDSAKLFGDLISSLQDNFVQGQAKIIWSIFLRVFKGSPVSMLAYIVGFLAFAMLILWTMVMSQGVLTRIAGRFIQKKQTSLLDGIATASRYFWDLCKVSIIFLLIGWGVWLLIAGLPTVLFLSTDRTAWQFVAQIGSYVSLFVSALSLFLLQYSVVELVVMEQSGAVPAIRRAWAILQRNMLLAIELALGLFIVNMISLVIFASVMVFFIFPDSIPKLVADIVILFLQLGLLTTVSYGATVALYLQMQQRQQSGMLGGWTEKIVNLAAKKPTV